MALSKQKTPADERERGQREQAALVMTFVPVLFSSGGGVTHESLGRFYMIYHPARQNYAETTCELVKTALGDMYTP